MWLYRPSSFIICTVIVAMLVEGGKCERPIIGHRYLTSFMTSDFVNFYRHSKVCLIQQDEEDGDHWMVHLFRLLSDSSHSKGSLTRIVSVEEDSILENSTVEACKEGLVVYRMRRKTDVLLLRKVFQGTVISMNWLLITSSDKSRTWLSNRSVYFPLNNRVTVSGQPTENQTITFWEIYQITRHGEVFTRPVGIWATSVDPDTLKKQLSNEAGIELRSSGNAQVREMRFGVLKVLIDDPVLHRDDLQGIHMKCACMPSGTRLIAVKENKDKSLEIDGFLFNLMETLASYANFTFQCYFPKDKRFGELLNNQWTGAVGEVVRGEADMALASLDMTYQRSQVLGFLMPIFQTDYQVVMKRPTFADHVATTYTRQFQTEVWVMIFVCGVVFSAMLKVCSMHCLEEHRLSLQACVTMISGSFFGQGPEVVMRRTPGRITAFTVLLLYVVLLAHYTSDLVSSLTLGPSLPPSLSIFDIARDPDMTFGFVSGQATTEYFKNSTSTEYRRIWYDLDQRDLVVSRDEGMKRVLEGSYGFLVASHYFRSLYTRDCRYFLLPKKYFPNYGSMAFKKGSPFIPLFNNLILKMTSSGITDKWHRDWTMSPGSCEQLQMQPVSLMVAITPFVALLCGMGVSSLLCVGEYLHHRYTAANAMIKIR